MPATSANLGPGFDVMGLALSEGDVLRCVPNVDDSNHVDILGEGADRLPRNERNLVVSVVRDVLSAYGVELQGLALTAQNGIPQARGLGSSAAAAVGGIAIAATLLRQWEIADMSQAELFQRACAIEGHPDNVAPAIFGGATISWRADDGFRTHRLALNAKLNVVVAVPAQRASTKAARAAQPSSVPLTSAVFNIARVALLTSTLAGDLSMLFEATDDVLHQPYRQHVMQESAALVAELRAHGLAAMISGAGPTVAVLSPDEQAGAAAVAQLGRLVDTTWRVEQMSVEQKGVTIEKY